MVSVLTSASNLEADAGRVPRANTGNLAQTSVGLSGETGDTPTSDDTFETMTLGDTDGIDHVVLGEDGGHRELLFEESLGHGDLGGDITTVDLDFHEVGLLLSFSERSLVDLGVSQEADDGAVLLDSVEILVKLLRL